MFEVIYLTKYLRGSNFQKLYSKTFKNLKIEPKNCQVNSET